MTGCASKTQPVEQARQIQNGDFILSARDTPAGLVWEQRVYVVAYGDSASSIASQFHVSISDIQALNPGLRLNRLYVGQKLRIYERKQG